MVFCRIAETGKVKLRNQKGDSIAEVLIALLISSLALVMLASMISSSTKMILSSKTKMNDYYLAMNAMNTFTERKTDGKTNKGTSTVVISFPEAEDDSPLKSDAGFSNGVDTYKNSVFQNKEVMSFKKQGA